MTQASQLRLCRAGIIIGGLFCVATVIEVGIGLTGLLSDFGEAKTEAMKDPEVAGAIFGEVLVVMVVRLWPLPLAMLFLVPSLLWRRYLRRKDRGAPPEHHF